MKIINPLKCTAVLQISESGFCLTVLSSCHFIQQFSIKYNVSFYEPDFNAIITAVTDGFFGLLKFGLHGYPGLHKCIVKVLVDLDGALIFWTNLHPKFHFPD